MNKQCLEVLKEHDDSSNQSSSQSSTSESSFYTYQRTENWIKSTGKNPNSNHSINHGVDKSTYHNSTIKPNNNQTVNQSEHGREHKFFPSNFKRDDTISTIRIFHHST